jgi:hypothetical protein
VGHVRARDCAFAGNLRRVRRLRDHGTRVDAAGRRTCRSRSAGAPTMGTELIARCWKGAPNYSLPIMPG